MKLKILILVFLLLSITIVTVSAEQATQNYAKIYLDPLYRQEMENDIWYDYTLNIETPDGISKVTGAMITMQLWLNPTVVFDLEIDDGTGYQTCNNPKYEVHTTFASAGEGTIYFDCSNIIKSEGTYDIRIMPSKDTGASTFWIDLTYFNDPVPEIQVHGTEYYPNQDGKTFIQLLDENNLPVADSTCFASIYYPGNTIWRYQQLMSYLDEGLYVFDFITPYQAGVYPVSAFCVLDQLDLKEKTVDDNFDTGTGSGGSGWDGNWVQDGCTIQTGYSQSPLYSLECAGNRVPYRDFESNTSFERLDYSFWYMGRSFESNEYAYVRIYDSDGQEFTVATVSENNADGVWRRVTGSLDIDVDNFNFDGTLSMGMDTSNTLEGNDYFYLDSINLSLSAQLEVNGSEYQIVRGSGEVHVTPEPNEYGQSNEYIGEIDYGQLTNETFDGYFYLHYDIVSLTKENKTDQKMLLPIWNAFPCESVQGVYLKQPNGEYELLEYSKILLGNRNDRCAVTYEQELAVGAEYEVYINATNYWRLEMLGEYEKAKINQQVIYDGCVYYQTSQGYPAFQIPIVNEITVDDEFYGSCQYYFDVFYNFNETVNTRFILTPQGTTNFTEDEMGEMEGIYLNLLQEAQLLEVLAGGILNTWQQGNDYPQAILGGGSEVEYLTFFANISGGWLSYGELLSVPINVWNYTGTLSINILDQISNAIWSTTSRTLTAFDFLVGLNTTALFDIWNHSSRELTYYPSASVNTTEIVNATWNYEGRYTHGITLN